MGNTVNDFRQGRKHAFLPQMRRNAALRAVIGHDTVAGSAPLARGDGRHRYAGPWSKTGFFTDIWERSNPTMLQVTRGYR